MYDLIGFGCELKSIRKQLSYTQFEVSKLIHMERDTLRRLENGLSLPKIETLDKLSVVYKVDIFMLFSRYRITVDNYISKAINRISKQFRNYNYDDLDEEIEAFRHYFNSTIKEDTPYTRKKLHQFETYLKCLANINTTLTDRSRDLIITLFLSLEVTRGQLKIKQFHLDKLEIRIVIMLGAVYRFKNEFIDAISLLDIALSEVESTLNHDSEFLYFYLLTQLNRMSHYHRLDDWDTVESIYKDTISKLDEKLGINNLSYFLIRAGINKHLANDPHLDGYVQTALQLLKDSGDTTKYQQNLNTLKEKYDFLDLELKYK